MQRYTQAFETTNDTESKNTTSHTIQVLTLTRVVACLRRAKAFQFSAQLSDFLSNLTCREAIASETCLHVSKRTHCQRCSPTEHPLHRRYTCRGHEHNQPRNLPSSTMTMARIRRSQSTKPRNTVLTLSRAADATTVTFLNLPREFFLQLLDEKVVRGGQLESCVQHAL